MRRSIFSPVSLDHRRAALAAMGYRLAAGGLPHRARSSKALYAPKPATFGLAALLSRSRAGRRAIELLYSVGREPAGAAAADSHPPGRELIFSQTTLLLLASALGSSLLLYWGKSRADMLDRELGRVVEATQQARARTYLLRAEWASQNAPDRLQAMADRYLALRPIAPTQYAPLAELPQHVATAAAAAAPAAAPAPETAADHLPAAVAESAPAAAAPHPAPPVLVHFEGKPHPPHAPAAPKFDLPHWLTEAHPPVRIMSDPPHPLTLPPSMRLPLAAPPPVRASVVPALAHPMPEPQRPASVAAAPTYSTPYAAPAYRPAYGYPYGGTYAQVPRPAYGGYYPGYYGGAYVAGAPYGYGRPALPAPVPAEPYVQ